MKEISGGSKVSVIKGNSPEKMFREAVDRLGGMGRFVRKGELVFVKPNMVSDQAPPATTPSEFVTIVTRMCLEMGAECVLVGDMPAIGEDTTSRKAMTNLGMDKAVRAAGGKVVYLDEEKEVDIDLPEGQVLKRIQIPEILLKADTVINMPMLKTHLMTVITCCIKNWHGIVPDKWKESFHRTDLHQKLVDLFTILRPKLNLIGAIQGEEGQGPCWGDPKDLNLVIASEDPVAGDAVASAVIGIDPFEVSTTYLGHVRGIGIGDLKQIEILGEPIEKVTTKFRRASTEVFGVIEEFPVYEGGVCLEGCKTNLRCVFDILKGTGTIDEIRKRGKKFAFVIGKTPVVPPIDQIDAEVIFIVGDCGVEGSTEEQLLSQNQNKKKVVVVSGCPPIGWTILYAKVLEECGIEFQAVY